MLTNSSTKSIGVLTKIYNVQVFSKESLYIDTLEFTLHDVQEVFQFGGIGQWVPVGEVTVNGRDRASLGQVLPHQTRPLVIYLEHALVTQHLSNSMNIDLSIYKDLIGVKGGISYLELFRIDRFLHGDVISWANYYSTVLCELGLNRVWLLLFFSATVCKILT